MDEKLRRQMQTLDRLYKESDRIGDDYAAHFGMNNTAFWVLYTLSRADKPVTQNDLCEEWFFLGTDNKFRGERAGKKGACAA